VQSLGLLALGIFFVHAVLMHGFFFQQPYCQTDANRGVPKKEPETDRIGGSRNEKERSLFALTLLFLITGTLNCFGGPWRKPPVKKAILLVAFGTSVPGAQKSFDLIDLAVKRVFRVSKRDGRSNQELFATNWHGKGRCSFLPYPLWQS